MRRLGLSSIVWTIIAILIAIAVGVALYQVFMSASQVSIIEAEATGIGSSTILISVRVVGSSTITITDIRLYDKHGALIISLMKGLGEHPVVKYTKKCTVRLERNGEPVFNGKLSDFVKKFGNGIRLTGGDSLTIELSCCEFCRPVKLDIALFTNYVVLVTDKGAYKVPVT